MKTMVGRAVICGLALATAGMAQYASKTTGAVFAATNDPLHNEIVMYHRAESGALQFVGKFATGGRGEGGINDPLQSQSSIFLSANHQYLLAVNAGSSSISVFRVSDVGLTLLSVKPSGGGNPVSVTMHDDLVYVANFGGIYHTAGFRMQPWGELEPISKSQLPLSGLDTEPSTIAFSPDGSKLVISERQTNKVDVFHVEADGSLSHPVFNNSQGGEPFGLQFSPSGILLVSEASSSSVSSYSINADNSLTVITSKSASPGAATCWVVTDGSQAWVTNAVTSNIAAFQLGSNGALTPLGSVAKQAASGPTIFPPIVPATAFPIDLALSSDSKYLYIVYSALGSIVGYQTGANGKLTAFTSVTAFAPQIGVEGLAVY